MTRKALYRTNQRILIQRNSRIPLGSDTDTMPTSQVKRRLHARLLVFIRFDRMLSRVKPRANTRGSVDRSNMAIYFSGPKTRFIFSGLIMGKIFERKKKNSRIVHRDHSGSLYIVKIFFVQAFWSRISLEKDYTGILNRCNNLPISELGSLSGFNKRGLAETKEDIHGQVIMLSSATYCLHSNCFSLAWHRATFPG